MRVKVIAFDFDGTIVDSAYECYLAALKAFNMMGENLEDSPNVLKEVMKARVFVKVAEDFYTVLRSIKDGSLDFCRMTQEEFNQRNMEFFDNKGTELRKLFYQIREQAQKEDFDAWTRLHKAYPGAKETINNLSTNHRIVIMTAKDRDSVSAFMEWLGIKYDELLDKGVSRDKRVQVRMVMDKYGAKPEEVLFIDDMLEHVLKVRETGVNVVMAGWGYSNQQQKDQAKKEGIKVLGSMKELTGVLEG